MVGAGGIDGRPGLDLPGWDGEMDGGDRPESLAGPGVRAADAVELCRVNCFLLRLPAKA